MIDKLKVLFVLKIIIALIKSELSESLNSQVNQNLSLWIFVTLKRK
jgi:hypothetical protein